jgi:hypothetical protein
MIKGTITEAETRAAVQAGIWARFDARRGTRRLAVPLVPALGQSFAQNAKIHFNPDNRITGSRLLGIELVSSAAAAKVDGSTDNAGTSQAPNGYLVLCDAKRDELITIPLAVLNRALNGNKIQFLDVSLQWDYCYIRLTNSTVSAGNGFLFNLFLD